MPPSGESPTEPAASGPGGPGQPAGQYGYGPGPGYQRPQMQFQNPFAGMGGVLNPELLFLIVAMIMLAIIAAISDRYDILGWVDVFRWLGTAYLLSRGIAKASRVYEQTRGGGQR